MAKKSMIARDVQRKKAVDKFAAKRAGLKKAVIDSSLSDEERAQAVVALQKLPRNSSKIRMRNRCAMTGRPRGYYRRFGLSRNKLRELMMRGEVPGVVKASW